MPAIKIKASDRVAFIGKTGSGKTELAKFFLSMLNRVLVIDTKHTFKMEGFKKSWSIPFISKSFRLIVRPKRSEDEKLLELLEQANREKNLTIYIDELSTLTEYFPESTAYLADIVRTGREKRVAVWSGMQRPRGTPRVFLSETETFFCFSLRAREDREYIKGFAGDEVMLRIPRFNFWYIPADDESATLMMLDTNKQVIKTIAKEVILDA